nr:hypothetical protein [uncultured Flavobacterium sp.]
MNKNKLFYIKLLIAISIIAITFHFTIFFKIVNYEITWGGKLKTDEEMYVFETISIVINLFFIFILLQKGNFIKPYFSKKNISFILWTFFIVFVLNTIGNIFADTTFEKSFTLLTLLITILLWKINKITSTT